MIIFSLMTYLFSFDYNKKKSKHNIYAYLFFFFFLFLVNIFLFYFLFLCNYGFFFLSTLTICPFYNLKTDKNGSFFLFICFSWRIDYGAVIALVYVCETTSVFKLNFIGIYVFFFFDIYYLSFLFCCFSQL